MLASQLLAKAHGKYVEGRSYQYQCRYCGTGCDALWGWWLWPPTAPEYMRAPGSHYICQGCYLYRRLRTTIEYIDGGTQDRQDAANHSWVGTVSADTAGVVVALVKNSTVPPADVPLPPLILTPPPVVVVPA